MPKAKGADIVGLKEFFKKEAKDLEKTFLSKLSDSDKAVYQSILATSWNDVNAMSRIVKAAGETLFPREQNAVVKLHQKLAEKTYSGIYSVFLLIPKASYIFKRAANVWGSFHDKGNANVENISETSSDFVVRGYPDLPKEMRDAVTGHISILLAKSGLKNITVKQDDSNPDQWVWHVTWN